MTMVACGDCVFWDSDGEIDEVGTEYGLCRRTSPAPLLVIHREYMRHALNKEEGDYQSALWPMTAIVDRCGDGRKVER